MAEIAQEKIEEFEGETEEDKPSKEPQKPLLERWETQFLVLCFKC